MTALNALDAGNLTTGTLPLGRISGLTTTQFAAATLVIESEGIESNDNDSTLATCAAIKDAYDTADTAQFASGGVIESIFGSWTDKDSGGSVALAKDEVYKVGSDGYLLAQDAEPTAGTTGTFYVYTDGSNPPTTARGVYRDTDGGTQNTLPIPIRKDDYWKVTWEHDVKIYWLPIGTGSCVKQ